MPTDPVRLPEEIVIALTDYEMALMDESNHSEACEFEDADCEECLSVYAARINAASKRDRAIQAALLEARADGTEMHEGCDACRQGAEDLRAEARRVREGK